MAALAPSRTDEAVHAGRQAGGCLARPAVGGTLPLFADLPPSSPRSAVAAASRAATPEQHLVAAQRLARRMRRLPERASRQTRAGQAICRHLIALLQEQG